jgi:hypothetical protein
MSSHPYYRIFEKAAKAFNCANGVLLPEVMVDTDAMVRLSELGREGLMQFTE